MGNKELGTRETGLELPKESSYQVLIYLGKDLPAAYRAMIYSRWLRSLRFTNDYFKLIDADSYYSHYQNYIKSLLERPECIVRIAALTEDQDIALGFSVSEPQILHYVHVQKDQRNQGVGKALTHFPFLFFTHLTKQGMSIWQSKFKDVKFDPFK